MRPLFNGTNWASFKFSVTIDLHDEGVFEVATGATPRPQENGIEAQAWDRSNWRALKIMDEHFTDTIRHLILHLDTASAVWTALTDMFESRSATNKFLVEQKFFSFKYNEKKPVIENLAVLYSLISECRAVDVNIEKAGVLAKLLYSLPDRYKTLIYSFENIPKEKQTLDKLIDFLFQKETIDYRHNQLLGQENQQLTATEQPEVQPAHYVERNGHAENNFQRRQGPNCDQSFGNDQRNGNRFSGRRKRL